MSRPRRYEQTDLQWSRLKSLLPGKPSDPGRSGLDNRAFVNGVLWVLRSGARWSDLPERYGKYKTVHKRFTGWAAAGVWEQVFAVLVKDRGNQYLLIDSTIVRAHQHAATGKGGPKRISGAFPRWTEHEDSHGQRWSWQARAADPHAGTGQRHYPGAGVAQGLQADACLGRQRL